MARIPRMLVTGDPTAYHVMSRTALDGFPLGDFEKDVLVDLIRAKSRLYFVEITGFCVMSTHFHILVRMLPEDDFSDAEVKERFVLRYGTDRDFSEGRIPFFREKWSSLSEFVKEIKQDFTRFYNKRHGRRGFFWGGRFKSVIVENGETLVNCLAYIDLNPVRAGIVARPEDYRWNSVGRHVQTGNKDNFLSLDFGLAEFGVADAGERLRRYRRFLYETGAIEKGKGACIDGDTVEKERGKSFNLTRAERFAHRTRHFSDSGIIGTKEFVSKTCRKFRHLFQSKNEKTPRRIRGLGDVWSMKRLSGY